MIEDSTNVAYETAFSYYQNGQTDEALNICEELIEKKLPDANPLFLAGVILRDRGAIEKALSYLHRATLFSPDCQIYFLNLGIAYHMGKMVEEAKKCYTKVLEINPEHPEACNNLGKIFLDSGKPNQALYWFKKCLESSPKYFQAFFNMGIVYEIRRDLKKAADSYLKCLKIQPGYELALNNLAIVFYKMHELENSIQIYSELLAINPKYSEVYNNMGVVYQDLGDIENAIACYRQCLEMKSNNLDVLSNLVDQLQYGCLWDEFVSNFKILKKMSEKALENKKISGITPLGSLKFHDDPEFNLKVAKIYGSDFLNRISEVGQFYPIENGHAHKIKKAGPRIKIGYVSDDFRDHAVSHVISPLFSLHDRNRFEIYCYSFAKLSEIQNDTYTKKIMKDCDQFVDISTLNIFQSAKKIYQDGIDIIVDLKGYTHSYRFGIFAYRPAPIQISYLGFLGTTGAEFIDYLIADDVVIPKKETQWYSEQIIYLPCYQVADYTYLESTIQWNRTECGLPEKSFVFCSFNQPYKFDGKLFDVWMRIIKKTHNSVLWLRHTTDLTMKNLKKAAQSRNVNPDRLIFAKKTGLGDHLHRLKLADLALDTQVYNGGATTSNALWAEVPVVTLEGRQFVARMSASSLSAIGLDELITRDLVEYEACCLRLASDSKYLQYIKEKLKKNKKDSLLFNMARFARQIENAYESVWQHYQSKSSIDQIEIS